MQKIIGIDPGSQFTGYGVIKLFDSRIELITMGVILLKGSFAERIGMLGVELQKIFEKHQPNVAVIEKIFLGKNADSAFKLGHARGVCICESQKSGCEIVEYATRKVKKGITGHGGASKEHVQKVLSMILGVREFSKEDVSDALALALYHSRILMTEEQIIKARNMQDDRVSQGKTFRI